MAFKRYKKFNLTNNKSYLQVGHYEKENKDLPFYIENIDSFEGEFPITFQGTTSLMTYSVNNIEYSYDNKNWEILGSITPNNHSLYYTINKGQRIYFRSVNSHWGLNVVNSGNCGVCFGGWNNNLPKVKIGGNILSLLYGNGFASVIPDSDYESNNGIFTQLFSGNKALVSAKDLVLPNIVGNYCYSNMFANCSSLIETPEFSVLDLGSSEGCYTGMFSGCTSLITPPELPAINLASTCYQNMFFGCTSLTRIPNLPSTHIPYFGYSQMFQGCTSLVEVEEGQLADFDTVEYGGCSHMFRECSNLLRVPTTLLSNATIISGDCYAAMFSGCSSLVQGPSVLPATSIVDNGSQYYKSMFENCSSLVTAPEIKINITIKQYSMYRMFKNCTSLNYIKVHFRSWSNGTNEWTYGLPSVGTFVCPQELTQTKNSEGNISNPSYIPYDWTIETF